MGFHETSDGKIRPHKEPWSAIPGIMDTRLPWDARGMASCKVYGVDDEGVVIHDCDSFPGSSGGPLVCRHEETWKLAGIHDGDTCYKTFSAQECYALEDGKEMISEQMANVSRAGQYSRVRRKIEFLYRDKAHQVGSVK